MLTGKGLAWGGSRVRTEATGYGAVYFVERMLRHARSQPRRQEGHRVGGRQCRHLHHGEGQELGGRVVACSDSGGYVVEKKGIDLDLAEGDQGAQARPHRRICRGSAAPGATFVPQGRIWDVPADVAMPSATQNELTGQDARTLVKNGVMAVGEGANMPCTPEAVRIFRDAGVLFGPGKATNAGGVATSALEMQQNASRDSWSFEATEARLAAIMHGIHDDCAGRPRNTARPETTCSARTWPASSAWPKRCARWV